MTSKEVLIVGGGISGATAARVLAENGMNVTVIEQRATISGNLYDYVDENGVTVQKYGPHIFHTNEKEVYDFLSKFTKWRKYEHRVLGYIDGKYVPIPFNLTSLFSLFPKETAEKVKNILVEEVGFDVKISIMQLKKHRDEAVRKFAEFVFEKVFVFYTEKQWGFKCEELGETVMNRVPVYISYEDRYFTDEYQFQPENGFTEMTENMLSHPSIKVELNKNALDSLKITNGKIFYNGKEFDGRVIFTGRIDDLFERKYGALPYRSLDFVFETHNTPSFQPAAVVNYTTTEKYTRISEFTKFACLPQEKTVIVKEYSKECKDGDIPYYPIPKPNFKKQYEKYLADAEKIPNLYLLGRLANYQYVNMDIAVKNALNLTKKILGENL